MSAETDLSFPIEGADFTIGLELTGDSMVDLKRVLPLDFPETQPYAASGSLDLRDGFFGIRDLKIEMGDSDLGGDLTVDVRTDPPVIEGSLRSHHLWLSDLALDEDPEGTSEDGSAEEGGKLQAMLHSVDGTLSIEIDDLWFTAGSVGSVDLKLQIDDGVLDLRHKGVQGSGGTGELILKIDGTKEMLDFEATADLDRYQYGPLLQFLDPESDTEGEVSLVGDLRSRPGPERLLERSSGTIGVVLYPEEVSPALLDMWGSPILRLIAGDKNPTEGTGFNCLAGTLELEDGLLIAERLVADTEATRLRAKGHFNLLDSTVDLKLTPRPKRRNVVDLALPALVHGPMADPEFTISKKGAALKVVKFTYWVITVWGEVFRKTLPADGSDVCAVPSRS